MRQGQLDQVAGEARYLALASILPRFLSIWPDPQKRGLGRSGLGAKHWAQARPREAQRLSLRQGQLLGEEGESSGGALSCDKQDSPSLERMILLTVPLHPYPLTPLRTQSTLDLGSVWNRAQGSGWDQDSSWPQVRGPLRAGVRAPRGVLERCE